MRTKLRTRNKDTVEERYDAADKLGDSAPLQHAEDTNVKPEKVETKTEAKSKKVKTNKLEDLLKPESKYSKKSKEVKRVQLHTNSYQKAAVYLKAKNEGLSVHEFLMKHLVEPLVKEAEKQGFDEETAKQIYDEGYLK